MRRKLCLLLTLCMLFANCITVSAAGTLPIAKNNRYTLNYHSSGVYEYVVPYTANFEVQLAGSQGGGYSNKAGGAGYLLTKTFRLYDGDVIRAEVGKQPDYYLDGDVLKIPGGQESKLYINDELVWVAGGGAGQIVNSIAPVGAKTVNVQNGNGTSAGEWSAGFTVHYHTGNSSVIGDCYGKGHFHGQRLYDVPCGGRIQQIIVQRTISSPVNSCGCLTGSFWHGVCPNCGWEGGLFCANHGAPAPTNKTICDKVVRQEWRRFDYEDTGSRQSGDTFDYSFLTCGKDERQILGYNNANFTAGSCYASESTGVAQALTNTGDGVFAIKLMEQDELFYGNRRNVDNWSELNESGAVTKTTDLELVVVTTMPVDATFKPTDGSPDGAEKVCVYFKRK